jgi:serine/threonine-protein kinase
MLGRIAAIATFMVCAGVVFWYALVHTVHLGTLAVPELRGLDVAQAEQTAHDLGLTLEVQDPGVFSASTEPGQVAVQEPSPGFHVKTGSIVRVRVSLGGERVAVPNLAGESSQASQRALEQVGLRTGLRAEVQDSGVADSVVATDPPSNVEVPPGAEIDVLVNTTPARPVWVMPSLLSRSREAVSRFCRTNGLRLGQVHEVPYPGVPANVVLRQYPPSGAPVTRSDIITVWVSR